MKITKAFYSFQDERLSPVKSNDCVLAYIATMNINGKPYQYSSVYDSDAHSDALEHKFIEDATIALENTKKKLKGEGIGK